MHVRAEEEKKARRHLYLLLETTISLKRWLTPEEVMTDNAESQKERDPFRWLHDDAGCWCDEPKRRQKQQRLKYGLNTWMKRLGYQVTRDRDKAYPLDREYFIKRLGEPLPGENQISLDLARELWQEARRCFNGS